MKLGSDFWLIAKIIMVVLKALIHALGDDEDKEAAKNNGF